MGGVVCELDVLLQILDLGIYFARRDAMLSAHDMYVLSYVFIKIDHKIAVRYLIWKESAEPI
jgi:hypothetical protein